MHLDVWLPRRLRRYANESFPSGDVAGAVSFALAMAPVAPISAAACVLLSSFGRVHWRAHHVLDCAAGGLLAVAARRAGAGFLAPANVAWYTPALALVPTARVSRRRRLARPRGPTRAPPRRRPARAERRSFDSAQVPIAILDLVVFPKFSGRRVHG